MRGAADGCQITGKSAKSPSGLKLNQEINLNKIIIFINSFALVAFSAAASLATYKASGIGTFVETSQGGLSTNAVLAFLAAFVAWSGMSGCCIAAAILAACNVYYRSKTPAGK